MLRAGKAVRSVSAKRRSRKVEPSGRGVNLLKGGSIAAGAIHSNRKRNPTTTAAAEIHQLGPVHSINFKTSARRGYPSNAASKNPFKRSRNHVSRVLVLKPNRSSSLNCAYQANGKLTMLAASPIVKRKPDIAQMDAPKAAVNFPKAHGKTPLNRIAMRSAVSNAA